MNRRFVAPGKLVVLGEYAVLDGAPALVLAVDRGVAVDVSPASTVEIVSPEGDRFVGPALRAAPPARYTFSAWNPVSLPGKPGLGHSAAATVVAGLAARALRGDADDRAALFAEASAVHRAVQGSGSGIDVAASTYGGLLRFERGVPSGTAASLLARLHLGVVFSGAPASTGPRVARYQALTAREGFVSRSAACVTAFEADPIGALREAAANLRAMAAAADLDWETPALARIAAIAEGFGGAAKASGAGGGDVAVALLPSDEARDAFLKRCEDAGFATIPCRPSDGAKELR